jgi:Putative binding domain, N-terminal
MAKLWAALIVALAAALAAACGSSSTTSTAPATVARCGVTLGATDLNVPAAGGSGTLAITTARECAWTASSNAAWLTIRGTSSGQGDGSVDYVASANADPATRRAVIELNDQRANVTQAAADCALQLADPSESFSPAGGSGTIGVQASSAMCPWTAVSDSSWIVVRSGASGTGNGTVTYDVAPAVGSPRTGTVLVSGLRFAVTQSESCRFAVSPSSYAPGASGGAATVSVATDAGCPWTAASNVPWVTVAQGAAGAGPGTVRIVVEATSGSSRTGSVLVAGQVVSVTQSGGCSFTVAPLSRSFGPQGGTGTATIEASAGCGWSASSGVPWIVLTGATSGNGSGSIAFTVGAVTGAARSGTISVAGTQITVTQGSGCAFSIAPTSGSVPAAGGTGSVAVTTAPDCAWTATSGASWITVTAGASGTGNGTVQYSAAATAGGPRSGTLTIAGQSFTVSQGSGCTFSIAPTSASPPAGGSTGSVAVTAAAGCAWTATSGAPWLTVTSGGSGTGNGTVNWTAAANSGTARSAALTIGGQAFTVNQASGCSFVLNPTSRSAKANGDSDKFDVTAGAGCLWTATSNQSWITITSGASGSGNGTVSYTVDKNTTNVARSGTITAAGQTFTVNQGK